MKHTCFLSDEEIAWREREEARAHRVLKDTDVSIRKYHHCDKCGYEARNLGERMRYTVEITFGEFRAYYSCFPSCGRTTEWGESAHLADEYQDPRYSGPR